MEFFCVLVCFYIPVTVHCLLWTNHLGFYAACLLGFEEMYGPCSSVTSVVFPPSAISRLSSELFLHSQDSAGECLLKSSSLWDSVNLWRKKQKPTLLWDAWEKRTLLRDVPSVVPFVLKNVNDNCLSLNWDSYWVLWSFFAVKNPQIPPQYALQSISQKDI